MNFYNQIFQLVTFNYDNINTTLLVSEKAKKYENTIEMVPMNNAFDEDVDLRSAITNYDSDYQDMMLSYQKYCEFSNKKNNIVRGVTEWNLTILLYQDLIMTKMIH